MHIGTFMNRLLYAMLTHQLNSPPALFLCVCVCHVSPLGSYETKNKPTSITPHPSTKIPIRSTSNDIIWPEIIITCHTRRMQMQPMAVFAARAPHFFPLPPIPWFHGTCPAASHTVKDKMWLAVHHIQNKTKIRNNWTSFCFMCIVSRHMINFLCLSIVGCHHLCVSLISPSTVLRVLYEEEDDDATLIYIYIP